MQCICHFWIKISCIYDIHDTFIYLFQNSENLTVAFRYTWHIWKSITNPWWSHLPFEWPWNLFCIKPHNLLPFYQNFRSFLYKKQKLHFQKGYQAKLHTYQIYIVLMCVSKVLEYSLNRFFICDLCKWWVWFEFF